MKKIIVLMLILAMCLSLCACGKANSANPTDAPTNDPDNPETVPAVLLPSLEVLYGEWNLTTEADAPNNPYTKLVVNENGTCFADGKEYTWKIDYEYSNEKNLFIKIFSNGEHICGANISPGKYFTAMKAPFEFCPGGWEKSK